MISLLVRKVVEAQREQGLREVWRRTVGYLRSRKVRHEFDIKRGTDTSLVEPLWRLQLTSPNARFGVRYQAVGEQELTAAIRFLKEDMPISPSSISAAAKVVAY